LDYQKEIKNGGEAPSLKSLYLQALSMG